MNNDDRATPAAKGDGGGRRRAEYGSAVNKALTVLEHLAEQPQAIGLPDLAARLDMPKQTLHRTLAQLAELGLITRDTSRDRFYVGPRLRRLAVGALFSENHNLPTRAILRALVDTIGESCNIGVLDGIDFVYLDRIETDRPLRIHLEVGHRVPAYCTSGGKCLLAHLDDRLRARVLDAATLTRRTATTLTTTAALQTDFERTRARGYATNDAEHVPGVVGVAAPIIDASGRVLAAVACHAPSARTSLADLVEYVPRVQEAAHSLGEHWS